MNTTKLFQRILVGCTLVIGTCSLARAEAPGTASLGRTKPNIVYILADDMGPGDVQAYNQDGKIPTPNIDRIAREGMKFMDPHTGSSVCTPTRYGIITGRYAWRTSLKTGVLGGMSPHLIDPSRETVASLLKKEGYRTACVGKWHLGMDWAEKPGGGKKDRHFDMHAPIQNGPLDVGFDYYFGIAGSLNMAPHAFIEGRQIQGTLEFLDDAAAVKARGFVGANPGWAAKEFVQDQVLPTLAKKARDWILNNASHSGVKPEGQPFFLYLPLNSPHSPIVPSKAFIGKSGLGPHGDFCMETDWAVGEILRTLDELNLAENTVVIFTSDNGVSPKAGLKEMAGKGHYSSWIYRGLKGTTWEGGHRVAFVARWPKVVAPASISNDPICHTDLIATCAELVGVELPDNVGEDSVSFLPALMGKSIPGANERMIVHHSDKGIFAVRRSQWTLLLDNEGGSHRQDPKDKPVINPADELLFDIRNDVAESTNLSARHPEVVEVLKAQLTALIEQGRSTPGDVQKNDGEAWWPELTWIRQTGNRPSHGTKVKKNKNANPGTID